MNSMSRKWVVLLFATLPVTWSWISWIGGGHRGDFAWAQAAVQDATKGAERRAVLIKREPVRVIEGDPYTTFNGMAIDEERGELVVSNNNEAIGASIQVYPVEFPPTDRIV